MEGRIYMHQVKIRSIDLMKINFQWNGKFDPKNSNNEYTASVKFTKLPDDEPDDHRSAFAYFIINRRDDPGDNFELSASYFLSIELPEPDNDRHEGVIKDIVAKVVWTRFHELAKFSLSQADIEGADIPIIPETVRTVSPQE
jgi:hypothetical protein